MVLILSCGCSRARGTLPFALTIPYDGVVCNFSASLRSVTSNSFDRCFAIYFAELPCSLVFFPKCGRYSSEARALKLDKQSKAAKQGRKNESSPYKNEPTVANKQQQTEQRQARRSANPPARFAYSLTKKENNSNMGPEPNAETTPIATIAFFSLWYGRSRSKARSLHEKKQLLRKLLHGHRWSHAAWQIIKTQTQTTKNTRQDADPPARFASHHQKDSKANSERGKSPTETTTKDLPRHSGKNPLCRNRLKNLQQTN